MRRLLVLYVTLPAAKLHGVAKSNWKTALLKSSAIYIFVPSGLKQTPVGVVNVEAPVMVVNVRLCPESGDELAVVVISQGVPSVHLAIQLLPSPRMYIYLPSLTPSPFEKTIS